MDEHEGFYPKEKPMTETFLRALAERFGLEVLKRITTGSERAHFATFELSGPAERVVAAWESAKHAARHKDFDRLTHVTNPGHPDHGKPYILADSVWCEVAPPPVVDDKGRAIPYVCITDGRPGQYRLDGF